MSNTPNILAPQANALELVPQEPAKNPADETHIDGLERKQHRKLNPSEVQRAIRLLADGISQVEVAKTVGVTQSAISLLAKRYEPTVDAARALIHARAGKVAREWLKAVPIAAQKGDHRPARDWLTAAGVVAPEQQQGAHITIQVGTGTSVTVDDADPFAQAKVITNEK